jgi:hypothetical protein
MRFGASKFMLILSQKMSIEVIAPLQITPLGKTDENDQDPHMSSLHKYPVGEFTGHKFYGKTIE